MRRGELILKAIHARGLDAVRLAVYGDQETAEAEALRLFLARRARFCRADIVARLKKLAGVPVTPAGGRGRRPKLSRKDAEDLRTMYYSDKGASIGYLARLFRVSYGVALAVINQTGAYKKGMMS